MSAPGPVALLGGNEHRDGCETIDRWMLTRSGAADPHVVVIPAASNQSTLPSTAALARNYWTALGAHVSVLHPRALAGAAGADRLGRPDIIVLTGGVPGRLVASLGASPVWERVLDLWRGGTALSGSSAGAMALWTWRLRLRAPRPLRLTPALGPLTGHVVVPHFDRFVGAHAHARSLVSWGRRHMDGLALVGIDEGTALIVDGDDAHVRGCGTVTMIGDGAWRTYRHGAGVLFDRPLLPIAVAAGDRCLPPRARPDHLSARWAPSGPMGRAAAEGVARASSNNQKAIAR